MTPDIAPRCPMRSIASLWKKPRFWLLIEILILLGAGTMNGLWTVKIGPDSSGYIALSQSPSLNSNRSLGFPLVLRAIAPFSPAYRGLPYLHLAALAFVVFLLDSGIRRFGATSWQAFAASSGVMFGVVTEWMGFVLTDSLGMIFAAMAVACVFHVVASPKRFWPWLGLFAAVAAAYHIRPAYLFLVPLMPCLTLILAFIQAKRDGEPFLWKRLFFLSAAGSVLPCLAFCLLRWTTVGDFNVTSFRGITLSGLAVELLDGEMVEKELPAEYRPLAREILARRENMHLKNAFKVGWFIGEEPFRHNYDDNVFRIALPLAKHYYGKNGTYSAVLVDRKLAELSQAVILLRKGEICRYYICCLPWILPKLLFRCWILWILLPAAFALAVIRTTIQRYDGIAFSDLGNIGNGPLMWAVFWVASLLFLCGVALVMLSGVYVMSRYVVAVGIFIPAWFALSILFDIQRIYAIWRLRPKSAKNGDVRNG